MVGERKQASMVYQFQNICDFGIDECKGGVCGRESDGGFVGRERDGAYGYFASCWVAHVHV